MIFVSVIIPVFNGERYIQNFFSNLKNQTFKKFEIIVINDGSTDNSLNILKNIKFQNLKIITYQKNKGVSFARNLGIKNANAKYLYFVDIDDSIKNNSLELLYKEAKKKNYDYICSDFKRIENKINQRTNKYNYSSDKIFDEKKIKVAMQEELYNPNGGHLGFFGCNGRLIKKSILKKNNIKFCEQLKWVEDKVFSWRVLGCVKNAKYIRKQLYIYYVQPNLSTGVATGIIFGNPYNNIKIIMKNIRIALKKKRFKKNLLDLYKQGIIFFCIQFLVSISRSILLKKIDPSLGKTERDKFINKILQTKLISNSINKYQISKYESKLIPKFITLKSKLKLEQACISRAKEVLKVRRLGRV